MSNIQTIIKLIEEGRSNSDHKLGQRQINEAVAMLRKMQDDSHMHSGQRFELSQILGCGPLYKDIEKAVKELKEAQAESWLPIDSAPKDGTSILFYHFDLGVIVARFIDGKWRSLCSGEEIFCIERVLWQHEPAPPLFDADIII